MVIKKNSTINHSKDFYDFSQDIGNYAIVRFKVRSFAFEVSGDREFTIKNLHDVFFDPSKPPCYPGCSHPGTNSNCINGEIEAADAEESMMDIAVHLAVDVPATDTSETYFEGYSLVSAEEIDRRYEWFFSEISKHFLLPPTRVYRCKTEGYDSYIGKSVFWGFCYIFINDNNNTGIVMVQQTFD